MQEARKGLMSSPLTPIIPQAVKALSLAGRSSGLPPFATPSRPMVSGSDCRKISPLRDGAYSSGNCTGFSPVSLLIRQASHSRTEPESIANIIKLFIVSNQFCDRFNFALLVVCHFLDLSHTGNKPGFLLHLLCLTDKQNRSLH